MVGTVVDIIKWIVMILASPIILAGVIIAIPIVILLELFDRFAYHMAKEEDKHPPVNEFCPVCGCSSMFFVSREKFVLAVENKIVPIKVKVKTCEECGCISVNKGHFSLACYEFFPKDVEESSVGFVEKCRAAFFSQHNFRNLADANILSRNTS